MKIVKVVGLVIGDTSYSESSKILHVLTQEYGRIGVLSKGCKSLKSKLRSVSAKITYGTFNIYYKEDGLSTLISVDIINYFNNIKSDLTKISYASYLMDLANQVTKDNKDIFTLLIDGLLKIEDGLNPNVITNIIEIKCLDYLGVGLELNSCVVCGSTKNIITIDGDKGGYICKNCHTNEYIVKSETIKLLRMFYYVDISKITEISIKENAIKEINDFIDRYYERYTGLYLKSKALINKIKI